MMNPEIVSAINAMSTCINAKVLLPQVTHYDVLSSALCTIESPSGALMRLLANHQFLRCDWYRYPDGSKYLVPLSDEELTYIQGRLAI